MSSDIEHALADLGPATKTEVEALVENRLTKCTNRLQSYIVKAVQYTFVDALKANYFSSNNGLKSTVSNIVEQALGKVVRAGRAPTVSEAAMHSIVHAKGVANTIVKSVLSNMGLIVPIAETV